MAFSWMLPREIQFGCFRGSAWEVHTVHWHNQALTVPGKSSAPCRARLCPETHACVYAFRYIYNINRHGCVYCFCALKLTTRKPMQREAPCQKHVSRAGKQASTLASKQASKPASKQSSNVSCVTQQTGLLCHTANMAAVSHSRHVRSATQQTRLLCDAAACVCVHSRMQEWGEERRGPPATTLQTRIFYFYIFDCKASIIVIYQGLPQHQHLHRYRHLCHLPQRACLFSTMPV